MGYSISIQAAVAELPSEGLQNNQRVKGQGVTSSPQTLSEVRTLGDALAHECTRRTWAHRNMVLMMLGAGLALSDLKGALKEKSCHLLSLTQPSCYRGSRFTIWPHAWSDFTAPEKFIFTVCPTCLIKDTIIDTYLPHQWWITTLHQGGFCLKKLFWSRRLVYM